MTENVHADLVAVRPQRNGLTTSIPRNCPARWSTWRSMGPTPAATADRFVLLPPLHVDREAIAELLQWAEPRGLTAEQAIQLAVCMFNEHRGEWLGCIAPPLVTPAPGGNRDAARPLHQQREP
jgi:hypothetical protein